MCVVRERNISGDCCCAPSSFLVPQKILNDFTLVFSPPPDCVSPETVEPVFECKTRKCENNVPLPTKPFDSAAILAIFYGVMWHGERFDIVISESDLLSKGGWTSSLAKEVYEKYRAQHGVTSYFTECFEKNQLKRNKALNARFAGKFQGTAVDLTSSLDEEESPDLGSEPKTKNSSSCEENDSDEEDKLRLANAVLRYKARVKSRKRRIN